MAENAKKNSGKWRKWPRINMNRPKIKKPVQEAKENQPSFPCPHAQFACYSPLFLLSPSLSSFSFRFQEPEKPIPCFTRNLILTIIIFSSPSLVSLCQLIIILIHQPPKSTLRLPRHPPLLSPSSIVHGTHASKGRKPSGSSINSS